MSYTQSVIEDIAKRNANEPEFINCSFLSSQDTLYTGNGYITYPAENVSIDMWDYIKDINYDSIVNPYEGLNNFYAENNKDKIDTSCYGRYPCGCLPHLLY